MSQQSGASISESEVIEIAKNALKSELMVTAIYRKLADRFRDEELSAKLKEFAQAEQFHANFWITFLKHRSQNPDEVKINPYLVNILATIYGMLGIGLTLKLLEAGERKVIQDYSKIFNSKSLTPQERTGVTRFLLAELAHEEAFTEYETKFKFFISKIATIFTQTSWRIS